MPTTPQTPEPRRFPVRSRLGDDIDDFCVKCKRVMNHAVVSLIGEEPAKVRCRTCHSDHDFRHELAPPPKVDPRKAALLSQALEKATGDVPEAGAEDVIGLEPETAVAEAEAPVAAPVKAKGRAKKA